MTPLVFALVCVCFVLVTAVAMYVGDNTKLKKYQERYFEDLQELRDKYHSILQTGNTREQLLKRGLEDLAAGEIDRARFVLEVVYGKETKS